MREVPVGGMYCKGNRSCEVLVYSIHARHTLDTVESGGLRVNRTTSELFFDYLPGVINGSGLRISDVSEVVLVTACAITHQGVSNILVNAVALEMAFASSTDYSRGSWDGL